MSAPARSEQRGARELSLSGPDAAAAIALARPNGWMFSAWLLAHLAVSASLVALIVYYPQPPAVLLLSLALGSELHALTVLQHDCGHRNAYRSQAANLWVGRFLAFFVFLPFTSFTELHKQHHRFTGEPEKDPDEWYYAGGPRWLFLREGLFMPRFIKESLTARLPAPVRARVRRELAANVVLLTLLVGASLHYGFFDVVFYALLLPMAVLALVINPIARGYEHFPVALLDRDSPQRRNLANNTVTVHNRWLGLLWANIVYHVEHHLYPGVPFYRLPRLHRLLRERRSYLVEPYTLYSLFHRHTPLRRSVEPSTSTAP